jgi:cob(I)alamin adenosyltransferase
LINCDPNGPHPAGRQAAAAQLHVARTVVRRAERAAWTPSGWGPSRSDGERVGGINTLAITYLNRLSDLLFILTRVVNGTDGDVLWIPGGVRSHESAQTKSTNESPTRRIR